MNRVLAELLTLLEAGMSTNITMYYQGEVDPVPQSNLPALMVFPINTSVIAKSTSRDQYVYEIGIRVVVNLKDYLNENNDDDNDKVMAGQEAAVNLMEERASDGTLVSDCVLGVLRDNVRGTDYLFNNDISIAYERITGNEFPYIRATMTLSATTDLLPR